MSNAEIQHESVQSLLIQPMLNGQTIALGTSFVVEVAGTPYLITNRHNVTGRDSNNQPLKQFSRMPDALRIYHNRKGQLGSWVAVDEPLYSGPGQPRWLEHPTHGRNVDVVALQLTRTDDVALYPHDPGAIRRTNAATPVTTDLNIVGFPFGLTGGGMLGVWSRGTIATEPEIDFNNLPLMLIDSRTRQGQSGSPVIYRASGSMVTKDGGSTMFAGTVSFLVGVYSGRVSEESDLGLVWKASVIEEVVAGGRSPNGQSLLPE